MPFCRHASVVCLVPTFLLFGAAGEALAEDDDEYSSYLELRIYQSQDGQRDRFLEYFEEHFLESQEAFPMRIWGQHRDLNEARHFVWMRGYRTMDERAEALMGFYTGEVWRERGPGVRDLLASAAHVHFLEPLREGSGFAELPERDGGESSDVEGRGVIVCELFLVDEATSREAIVEFLDGRLVPRFESSGGVTLGLFEASDEANNFPMLRFIEDEHVIVWIGSFESEGAHAAAREVLGGPEPFETFVLEPGARSRLGHWAD